MTIRSGDQHVQDDDLVLHFYGETERAPAIEQHLRACALCRASFEELGRVLALVDTHQSPDPGPGFERTVWARVSAALDGEPRLHAWAWLTSRWVLSGAVAALLVVAFIAGRMTQGPRSTTPAGPALADVAAGRVLVVAVVDHLDRSQMVLLEVLNRDLVGSAIDGERLRARDLVAANRLYRQSAAYVGDQSTLAVLDELERVLIEIANTPDDTTPEELEALQARIESRGVLFKVRVVHSEMRERERQASGPLQGPA